MATHFFGLFFQFYIPGKALGDGGAVGQVVARAIKEHADAQGDAIVHLDFFLLFFEGNCRRQRSPGGGQAHARPLLAGDQRVAAIGAGAAHQVTFAGHRLAAYLVGRVALGNFAGTLAARAIDRVAHACDGPTAKRMLCAAAAYFTTGAGGVSFANDKAHAPIPCGDSQGCYRTLFARRGTSATHARWRGKCQQAPSAIAPESGHAGCPDQRAWPGSAP
ncbi:hypothetical protein D3C79_625450 [compost metagenome]